MKRNTLVLLMGLVVIVGGVLLVASRLTPHASHLASVKATYYCPMHPSYTSDRPGDCPICSMRLVQREAQGSGLRAQGQSDLPRAQSPEPRAAKDICYLHNCTKLHEGKPCPMTVVAKPGEKVICPICGTHVAEAATQPSARTILYWTDPMIPGYRSDKPGKSPMGMDLVPVYAEETPGQSATGVAPEGYTAVLLTPQKQQLIGVKTAPVQRRALTKTIRTVGRIAYDPDLYQTEAEHLQSLKALEQAKAGGSPEAIGESQRLVDSSRMKLRLMGLSDALIQEMAGWDGPDKRLLLSDAAGQVWVYAPVYEFELPYVKAGQTMRVEIPTQTGTRLEGAIRSIDPVLDPATRSAKVRAVIAAPEGTLRPEMFVNASIEVAVGDVMAVPEDAVFNTGTKQIVFVDKGQGLFEPRDVAVGMKADGYYEVKSGVSESEAVVTSGNFLIDSESRLKAALEGMSGGHQHGGQ